MRKILLVENEPLIAVLTRMDLENLGFKIEVATTAADAIQLAREFRPDLIFMDYKLDGERTGAEAADEIQDQLQIPIIFVTGSTDIKNVQKCLATKPVGFIHKPARTEDLERAIEHVAHLKSLLERFQHSERYPYHDELTGLSNRRLLIEEIRLAFQAHSQFAVLYIDIDRFKRINNSLGFPWGDQFLKLFASKLEVHRRPAYQIARVGSDEFAILMNDTRNLGDAISYAETIHSLMNSPFLLNEQEVFATLNIGIVHCGKSGYDDPESILNDAETAMHQSIAAGKNTAVFNRKIHSQTLEHFHLENQLHKGMIRKEFAVYYQPIVQLNPYKITGFEALLRWNHPTLGLIEANEIVPVAEKAGVILPLGTWVLEEACEQLASWQPLDPDLSIHVNLSAKHFLQQNLVSDVKRILEQTRIEPSRLKIEITENFVIDYTESVLNTMIELQSLNIGLQIDDFGKGYSSLSYLHQFPLDALKIDRSFVQSMGENAGSREIIEMIVSLGKKLQLKVIAEGVETSSELRQIQDAGCQYVQGYLFSVPVDAREATKLLLDDTQKPFAA
jgi:diguanylate cyclase (GGDEF)-like protein